MPVAIPFDTLDYARKLEVAGVPTAQAELQATALGEALSKAVATPADLSTLESRLTARIDVVAARIDAVEASFRARIDALDIKLTELGKELRLELGGRIDRLAASFDMMKWTFGLIVALNIGILLRLLMIR